MCHTPGGLLASYALMKPPITDWQATMRRPQSSGVFRGTCAAFTGNAAPCIHTNNNEVSVWVASKHKALSYARDAGTCHCVTRWAGPSRLIIPVQWLLHNSSAFKSVPCNNKQAVVAEELSGIVTGRALHRRPYSQSNECHALSF